jgi:chemotaxis protein MotB
MAGEKDKDKAPIVIKRVKKGGHGFHGGVWKIAYADFVTAMMAFFLLMWVLGSTTRGDLAGISAYFQNPLRVAVDGGAGSGDATRLIKGGGESMMHAQGQEAKADSDSTQRSKSTTAAQEPDDEARKFQFDSKAKNPGSTQGVPDGVGMETGGAQGTSSGAAGASQGAAGGAQGASGAAQGAAGGAQGAAAAAAKENAQAQQQVKAEIERAVKSDGELSKIKNQLMMDITSDGLRLQIVDEKNRPMFESGGTVPAEHIRRLMRIIGKVVGETNFAIKVEGHTDSKGIGSDAGRGNWELSTDRANAARREMVSGGLRADQVAQVVGYADKLRVNKEDPNDPINRRISITVLANTAAGPKTKAPGTEALNGLSGGIMPGASPSGPNAPGAPLAPGLAAPTLPDSPPAMAIRPEIKREVLEAARRAGGIEMLAPLPAGARGKSER